MTFEEKVEQIKQMAIKGEDLTQILSELYWAGAVAGGNNLDYWAICFNYMRMNPHITVPHQASPPSFGARASGTNES